MISISKTTQDTDGNIIINESPDSELLSSSPRISRTATLDGGAVVEHYGFAEGDRTFKIRATITEAQYIILWALHKESLVYVSCEHGFFSAVIQTLRADNAELYLTILIKEKLST